MSKYGLQFLSFLFLFVACKPEKQSIDFNEKYQNIRVVYPNDKAYRDTAKVSIYGQLIADSFQMLGTTSALQQQWLKKQQSLTDNYFEKLPFREGIEKRLEALWDHEVYSPPERKGAFYFFYKKHGKEVYHTLYRRRGVDGALELVLDPNQLPANRYRPGTEAISGNGNYLAYQVAQAGKNVNDILILDITTQEVLTDTIKGVKSSSVAWYGDGFFYSRFAVSGEGQVDKFHQVYYHTLGQSPDTDLFVFGDRYHPNWVFDIAVTEDEKFLVLISKGDVPGNGMLVRDLTAREPDFVSLVDSLRWNFELVGNDGDDLLMLTNYRSPMQRLVRVDLSRPEIASWEDVLPVRDDRLLEEVHLLGGKLLAKYLYRATTQLEVYDLQGQLMEEIGLPKGGVVEKITGSRSSNEAFFACSSIIQPRSIYRLNMNSFDSEVYQAPRALWDPLDLEFEQIWYSSFDKKSIPMFVYHKKGVKLDGTNPLFLFCNGGFNQKLLPHYNPTGLHLFTIILENGGVCAIPHIRGGGEFGYNWYQAGLKKNKKNSFNDFLFAAQYLINKKYTSAGKMAIYGEGHGGLVVGYSVIERPDMFQVALPNDGIFDLLRQPANDQQVNWRYEFGNPALRQDFNYLYAYSPVYRVEDTYYPAVLISAEQPQTTKDQGAAYRFAAALQSNQLGLNPILIRTDPAGEGQANQHLVEKIDKAADILTFMFYNLEEEALYE